MSKRKAGSKTQPFPKRRPTITITPSRAKPFAIDCRELRWWFGVPEIGDRTLWAIYDPPGWSLTCVSELEALRPAEIHNVECVETQVDEWGRDSGWRPAGWMMYGRVTKKAVAWLATSRIVDGTRVLYTCRDDDFAEDWGEAPRRLEDRGRFVQQADGSYTQRKSKRYQACTAVGAGVFRVRVGRRAFTCLRVLDAEPEASERGILMEGYLTRDGRTLLCRRYNGRRWDLGSGSACRGEPWDRRFPDNARLVIDGATYVHWYDCLSDRACGIRWG